MAATVLFGATKNNKQKKAIELYVIAFIAIRQLEERRKAGILGPAKLPVSEVYVQQVTNFTAFSPEV